MSSRPSFSELEDQFTELLETRGGRIWNGWKAIDTSVAVLQGNVRELGAPENKVNTDIRFQMSISGVHSTDREALLLDLERRLLNFLASATTVDDQLSSHASRLHRHTLDPMIKDHRENLVARQSVITFVRVLRNIAIHLVLPEVAMNTSVFSAPGKTNNEPGGGMKISFNLNHDHCHALITSYAKRRDPSETQLAFQYLDQNEDISLKDMSDQFANELIPLVEWQKKLEFADSSNDLDEFTTAWNSIADVWNS